MTQLQAELVLNSLKRSLPLNREEFIVLDSSTPFELLISTILSQNTNDNNSMKAFKMLKEGVGTDPATLSSASLRDIEETIRVGGLYHKKAWIIKLIASKFNGFKWDSVSDMRDEDLRGFLMSVPGVGPKTADIFLLFYAKRRAFPVDTHISRVARRLGLADEKADYEAITERLKNFFSPSDYLTAHLELIALGRKFCKARSPLCDQCPLNEACPSAFKLSRHHQRRLSRH